MNNNDTEQSTYYVGQTDSGLSETFHSAEGFDDGHSRVEDKQAVASQSATARSAAFEEVFEKLKRQDRLKEQAKTDEDKLSDDPGRMTLDQKRALLGRTREPVNQDSLREQEAEEEKRKKDEQNRPYHQPYISTALERAIQKARRQEMARRARDERQGLERNMGRGRSL